jgi:hypothetical protein
VEGPACEFKNFQGLLIKTASPAPWISDPTTTDLRVRRGPHRAPGARVHGGPPASNEGVRDQGRSCEIRRPWTRASDGRRRRCRRAAACGGSSPALALDGAPGHLSDHGLEQNDAGTLAHVYVGFMGDIVPHRRPEPEGGGAAAPASSWARGCARKEGKLGGKVAHGSRVKRASSKTKEIQQRRGLATAAGRAALRRGQGAAPTGSEDGNLQPIELDEPLVNPKRREGRRRRGSFTDGDVCTAAAGNRGGGAGEIGLNCVRWCAAGAKGGAGARVRA